MTPIMTRLRPWPRAYRYARHCGLQDARAIAYAWWAAAYAAWKIDGYPVQRGSHAKALRFWTRHIEPQ